MSLNGRRSIVEPHPLSNINIMSDQQVHAKLLQEFQSLVQSGKRDWLFDALASYRSPWEGIPRGKVRVSTGRAAQFSFLSPCFTDRGGGEGTGGATSTGPPVVWLTFAPRCRTDAFRRVGEDGKGYNTSLGGSKYRRSPGGSGLTE